MPATLLALASVPGAGAIVTLWPAAARAQTPPSLTADQKQEMKIHYERGQRAYDIGKYADAIDEYAKVYEIGGNPAMLFNIAQAHRLNNQLPEALRFYRRYLQRSPNAPNRADVETKIAELEKSVDDRGRAPSSSAAVVPPATTPAPPAVNPAPPATSAAPAATPPPKVETPPPPPPTPPVSPPPPAPSASTEPPPVTAPTAPEPAEPTSSASNGRTIAVISLLAVGAAGLVLAAFEGLSASSKADTITAQSKAGNTVFDPAIETAGRRANAIAITSGIIGVAALGVGGYLFFSRPTATEEAPGTRVSIAPWVTPSGLIGAGAAWAY